MQYSTKAISQLASITPVSGTSLKRRWPYQARVMKTLEPISRAIGSRCVRTGAEGMEGPGWEETRRLHVSEFEAGPALSCLRALYVDPRRRDRRARPVSPDNCPQR